MRPVMRKALVVVVVAAVGLLALGALPGQLGGGGTYHLVVEPTDDGGPAVEADAVPERRFPFLADALASDEGRSESYEAGRFGVKEAFTHTPFDEVDALAQRNPDAEVAEGRVRIDTDEGRFYAEVVEE